MIQIDVLPGAKVDLAALKQSDPDALAVIVAFLEEADADKELIDRCTTHGDVVIGSTSVNVKGWVKARGSIGNLWRIQLLEIPEVIRYRTIYGYDWHTRRIGILAVVHRDDFNYEISGELADRIQADWDRATDGRST